MIGHLQVEGITGPSGARYVLIQNEEQAACLSLAAFVTDEKYAKRALLDQGIVVVAASDWRKLMEKVGAVRDFPPGPIIEKIGWNEANFALPDGSVLPASESNAPIAIELSARKCAKAGKFKKWYRYVALPLQGQHLATFLLMSAFAAPLLRLTNRVGNFGFEIVGKKGTGKSTLQFLVSSALGGVGQGSNGHYWVTLDTTYNALEKTMKHHSDMPIIMDEANLFAADATPRTRAGLFQALAFKLGSGSLKSRYGEFQEADYRLIFITSSNEPLATLLGQSTESARAAADRLLTLHLDDARQYGVFDFLPKGYASSSQFAQDLMRAADANHGHAIKRFLARLVAETTSDEGALRDKIQGYIDRFCEKAAVDKNDGSEVRVASAFGLVFAAGKLAQEYDVLPHELRPKAAALTSFRLHVDGAQATVRPFAQRLGMLVSDERIAKLKKQGPTRSGALGFKSTRRSQPELLIPSANIEAFFPDWPRIKNTREVKLHLVMDDKRLTVKRRIGDGRPQRVHCFKLP